ncbi:MAG TPA: hypothetical protein VLF59_04050 [Candidatus Saccharimonadales bacterium]|nr:hypothetical protein [Candidatus Saccharimonadales bacterium]
MGEYPRDQHLRDLAMVDDAIQAADPIFSAEVNRIGASASEGVLDEYVERIVAGVDALQVARTIVSTTGIIEQEGDL